MQPISFTTETIPKPAGRTAGPFRVRVFKDGSLLRERLMDVPGDALFDDVPNGAIVIEAARLDTDGNMLRQVTREYTVTDGETIVVPLAILVGGA